MGLDDPMLWIILAVIIIILVFIGISLRAFLVDRIRFNE
jgi:hypothetical protein